MGYTIVSWSWKKRAIVKKYSVEEGYILAWEATCDIFWLHKVLQDLGVLQV